MVRYHPLSKIYLKFQFNFKLIIKKLRGVLDDWTIKTYSIKKYVMSIKSMIVVLDISDKVSCEGRGVKWVDRKLNSKRWYEMFEKKNQIVKGDFVQK